MSLNPSISRDSKGVYWINWSPDSAASGYAITTQSGASRTFNPAATKAKLGANLTEPVTASVTPLRVAALGPREQASYPPVVDPPPPPPPPPPTGVVDGVGIVRYAGSLPQTSHLNAYGMLIADWDQAGLLAKQPGMSFAYRNMGPPGTNPVYPNHINDTDGFVNEVLAQIAAHPGLDGVFIDNVSAGDKSWCLPFLANIGPRLKAKGVKVMFNAVASSGSAGNDGTGDAQWYAQVGPHATHLMSEEWMQGRGGAELFRLRRSGSAHYSDYWDEWLKLPAAAHKAGCAFVGMTYGSLTNAVYGRASLLLVAEPGDVFCWNPDDTPSGTDPYNPAWMKSLGAAVDPAGSNPRRFANGVASVNPGAGTASIS